MNKSDFPIFKNYPDLIYLDSAASSQKPQSVIDAVTKVYETSYANIHRGIYDLSQKTTELYETTRETVANFINASDTSEIVFTSGTTESLNLVAKGFAKYNLQKDDIVVLSEMEHHSNIVPWLELQKEIEIKIVYLPISDDFTLEYKNIFDDKNITRERIKIVSLTHASNTLGTINPLKDIIAFFRKHTAAICIVDAAQSIPHFSVDVQDLDCDFLAFSSHKMLGPSGVGVLWGRKSFLERTNPQLLGGHMIKRVTKEKASWAEIPERFEGGTRNIEGVIGLGAAIEYLSNIGMDTIASYEKELTMYAVEQFRNADLTIYGPATDTDRLAVFSFGIEDIHPHDIAEILNRNHIAIRSGHHCTQILMDSLCIPGTARASFYLYNTKDDVDRLIAGINEVRNVFRK